MILVNINGDYDGKEYKSTIVDNDDQVDGESVREINAMVHGVGDMNESTIEEDENRVLQLIPVVDKLRETFDTDLNLLLSTDKIL